MYIIGEKNRIINCPLCGIGLEAEDDAHLLMLDEAMNKARHNYIKREYEAAKVSLWGKPDEVGEK